MSDREPDHVDKALQIAGWIGLAVLVGVLIVVMAVNTWQQMGL